ncbi:MAG: hypothetical protein DDT24_00925 [Chloroflexi bacterium]|nr:hypothetical protein [Chloroflexota bacterium]
MAILRPPLFGDIHAGHHFYPGDHVLVNAQGKGDRFVQNAVDAVEHLGAIIGGDDVNIGGAALNPSEGDHLHGADNWYLGQVFSRGRWACPCPGRQPFNDRPQGLAELLGDLGGGGVTAVDHLTDPAIQGEVSSDRFSGHAGQGIDHLKVLRIFGSYLECSAGFKAEGEDLMLPGELLGDECQSLGVDLGLLEIDHRYLELETEGTGQDLPGGETLLQENIGKPLTARLAELPSLIKLFRGYEPPLLERLPHPIHKPPGEDPGQRFLIRHYLTIHVSIHRKARREHKELL